MHRPDRLTYSTRLGNQLRRALLERIHDKEPSVRSQAVIALCKIIPVEDPTEEQEEALESLLEVLILDPSSYVLCY